MKGDRMLWVQRRLRALSCVLILSAAAGEERAQAQMRNDCAAAIRSIYDRMIAAADNGICRVRYTTRIMAQAGGRSTVSETTFNAFIGAERMQLVGEDISVYQDRSTLVVLMPHRKTITLRGMSPRAENVHNPLTAIRDSLLAHARLTECVMFNEGGADHRATFILPEKTQRASRIQSVTFLYSEKGGTLRKVVLHHVPGDRVRSEETTFESVDYDYRGSELARPAIAAVLDANGNLLPRYRGYAVQDLRR